MTAPVDVPASSREPGPSATRLRTNVVACLLIAVWAVIALRLIAVQGFSRVLSERSARRQRTFVETLPARPGDIRDRARRLLATSIRTHSLALDPSEIDEPRRVAESLAGVLGLDADALAERIVAAHGKRFLWVRRQLTPDEAESVAALQLPPAAWHFRVEHRRVYPQGTVASHVLGRRDIDGVGRGGAEEAFERWLVGRDGRRTLVRDARGFVIDVDGSQTVEPVHGRDVRLTIDSVLQADVERRMDELMDDCRPLAACAVVLDPRTGEVLAMASRPQLPIAPEAEGSSAKDEDLGWRNHALSSMFEPGSTFKPFIVAAALDQGLIARDESFHCGFGAYRMGRRVLHDHHAYGLLSVADVLVKSSNIGMAKIGERLTNDGLYEAATAFGFGRRTGIELPGESPGRLHPLERWTSYSTGSIPMGQELAATPLQVAAAHAALANGGVLLSPHVLLQVDGPEPAYPAVVSRPVASEETARWLVQGPLVDVVRRGTGQKAKLAGYSVFGKTGTAQKQDPETGGYSHSRHIGSFVCGAPATSPRAVVLVAVDEPTRGSSTFGGIVAAPAAADILRATLESLQAPPSAGLP
ncbi:MAG: penicillin-binding protein 2 [Planctomyces sp.]|nr:penicillin-binding protein 2 [Planctomyces sp.]